MSKQSEKDRMKARYQKALMTSLLDPSDVARFSSRGWSQRETPKRSPGDKLRAGCKHKKRTRK